MAARVGALLKQSWNEIPEVVGSAAMGLVGFGAGMYAAWVYKRDEMYNEQHRYYYTVYRHDDPKAEKLRPPRRDDLKYGL